MEEQSGEFEELRGVRESTVRTVGGGGVSVSREYFHRYMIDLCGPELTNVELIELHSLVSEWFEKRMQSLSAKVKDSQI